MSHDAFTQSVAVHHKRVSTRLRRRQALDQASPPLSSDVARIDRHSGQLDALDVEGILAFAERVLPRAADAWVQASLEQRQRFQ